MLDYFNDGVVPADGNIAPNGVPQQQVTNGEDLGMAEISVSHNVYGRPDHICN